MMRTATQWTILPVSVVLLAVLALRGAWAAAQEAPAAEQPPIVTGRILVLEATPRDEPAYWIGIACHPLDKETVDRLKLESDHGTAIEQVLPESPAAKAGLAKDDVIVAVDEKPLEHAEQLVKAVAAAKDQPLKLAIIRAGQRQSIEVTPAPRPVGRLIAAGAGAEGAEHGQARDQAERAQDNLRRALEDRGYEPKRVEEYERAFRAQVEAGNRNRAPADGPGPMPPATGSMLLQGGAAAMLPDDMSVTVRKRGHEPAKVVVKQGNKAWKTTEEELEMLPPAARSYVGRLLGRPTAMRVRARALPAEAPGGGADSGAVNPKPVAPKPAEPRAVEVQIDGARLELTNPPETHPGTAEMRKVYEYRIREAAEPKRAAEPAAGWTHLVRPQPEAERIEQRVRELRLEIERLRKEIEERRAEAGTPPAESNDPQAK